MIDQNAEITDRIVHEELAAHEFLHLPLSQLVPSEKNPRRHIEREPFAELKRSIEENGLLQPIVVRPVGERYEIIGGHQRFAAVSELASERPSDPRFRRVAAMVVEVEDALLPVLQLAENVNRADLAPLEIAAGAAQAIKDGAEADEVAARLGWNRRQLNRYLQLHAAPEWLKQLTREVKISTRRRDARGEVVMDGDTNLPVVDVERLPGLSFNHVFELMTAYNVLQQRDAERLAMGGDGFKPEAERLVRRLARDAAVNSWGIAKLRAEIKKAKDSSLEPTPTPTPTPMLASPLIVTKERATLDLSRARSVTGAARDQLASQLSSLLTEVGFRVVVVKT